MSEAGTMPRLMMMMTSIALEGHTDQIILICLIKIQHKVAYLCLFREWNVRLRNTSCILLRNRFVVRSVRSIKFNYVAVERAIPRPSLPIDHVHLQSSPWKNVWYDQQ